MPNRLHRTPRLRLGCKPDITGAGSVSRAVGCIMRSYKITVCVLPMLAFGCAQRAISNSGALLSFPDRLRERDQIVGFALEVRNGTILAVDKVPRDWSIHMLAEWPGSEMSGEPNHGASAFQNMTPLSRFVTIHKDCDPFEITGSLVTTTDFTTMRTNLLRTEDFILEQKAPNPQGGANGRQPLRSGRIRASQAAASRRSP